MEEKKEKFFIDVLSNRPKTDKTREDFAGDLRKRLEEVLSESVERIFDLPPIMVKEGDYISLLNEAREIYVAGHFYSCVAMSGIVAERLVKDLLRASLLVVHGGKPVTPSDKAFDQFERVEVNGIVQFLRESELLTDKAAGAAKKLGELRNAYAHARGKDPKADAQTAIALLDDIVEGTVSVFDQFICRS